MSWTYADISAKVRTLTGRPSTNQLSASDLLTAVNNHYLYIFPNEVRPPELSGWYTFNTADGTGSQVIDSSVFSVTAPVYVDNDPASLWTDEGRFHDQYPHDTTAESTPRDILLLGRTLYLRPIPDDTYEARLKCVNFPKVIKADSSVISAFVDGTDKPQNEMWGPMISYGTSIEMLKEAGQDDEAQALAPMYKFYKTKIDGNIFLQKPTGSRPRPRF